MYSHHKFDHEFEGSPPPHTSYIVSAVPRSGSSLLCELLTNTGLAGAPTEFFDLNQMNGFKGVWGVTTLDEYIQELLAKKTGPNGVFGFKAFFGQLSDELGLDRLADFPNLHYVHIRRNDRLRQAISFARAMQTEQWASDHPVNGGAPIFRPEQIDRMLEYIEGEELGWEHFFTTAGITPHRVVYEDFIDSTSETVIGVMRFLGIDLPAGFAIEPPSLRKQADELSEEWLRRYLELRPAG